MRAYWFLTAVLLVTCGWFFVSLIHEAESMTIYWSVAGTVAAMAAAIHALMWLKWVKPHLPKSTNK